MSDSGGFAKIEFLPVCSKCHKVIYDKIDYEADIEYHDTDTKGRFATREHWIYPAVCTNCGSHFVGINMPTTLPFDNSPTILSRGDYQ